MDSKIIQIKASLSDEEKPYVFYVYCKDALLKSVKAQQAQKKLEEMKNQRPGGNMQMRPTGAVTRVVTGAGG